LFQLGFRKGGKISAIRGRGSCIGVQLEKEGDEVILTLMKKEKLAKSTGGKENITGFHKDMPGGKFWGSSGF